MADKFKILAEVELTNVDNIQSQLKNQHIEIGADTSGFEMSISVANAIMNEFIDIAKDMVDEVYTLDAAITEFKKVSDLRGSGLDEYVEQLGELGQITARTTSEMVDAATSFKKAGFDESDSKTLALIAT